jgi:hypothetical protein
MRHRLVVASLLLLLALPLTALPAAAAPAVATVTLTDNGDCSVTVTYTWSGFNGHNLTAEYAVVWPADAGGQFGLLFQTFPVAGSGTSSHTFDLTGHGSHTYSGRGYLLKTNARRLSGSDVGSPTSADLSC